ncbi:MAG: hypothetical protein R3E68_11060 [Burkholderiaceae bacterium]
MSMFDGELRFLGLVRHASSSAGWRCSPATRMMLVLSTNPSCGNKIMLKLVQLLSERLRQTSAKLVSYLEAARET